jgi:microsomal epoxide hydrolase
MDEVTMAIAGNDPASTIHPFVIDIPDAKLDAIYQRVRAFDWPHWKEPADSGDWRYGPPAAYMRDLCRHWTEHYDWRHHERRMNAVPNFLTNIDGADLHYVHERGSGSAPMPLLVAHGWPYSFHSYSHLIERLAHPERFGGRVEDAFSVVVPSYPGYDFSAPPAAPMGPRAIGFAFDRLMARLGYDRYAVHGGDWGAHITSLLAFHAPERIVGIHSTALAQREAGAEQLTGHVPPGASDEDRAFIENEYAIWEQEGAYSRIHATKPAKLGYAMFDSPVGVAAWIVEAFHAWSDRRQRAFGDLFSFDQLLTEVMLYLVTDAFPTSTWIYGAKRNEEMSLPEGQRVRVPTAMAAFPDPVFPVPSRQAVERSHDVVQYTQMPRGGHFPFYEEPDLLVEDLFAFRRRVTL